jgi:hypothetical protein
MKDLSHRYPIEWGILIDRDRKGAKLFPSDHHVERFRTLGVRLCAHICGSFAIDIAAGRGPYASLAGFSRIQVNHGRDGADQRTIDMVSRFAASHGVRAVLQCGGDAFPTRSTEVDWLYDVSFGEGVSPNSFPTVTTNHPFCGISGGINPETIVEILAKKISVAGDCQFWIDMESGVRTNGKFDLDRCEGVCRAVYE